MPIRSFIAATRPLEAKLGILPGGESVDDTRFVVRYFRRSPDGRLLFGGRETYMGDSPGDIASQLKHQIREVFPNLKDVEITHAWGGTVAITPQRRPFVREVLPGVVYAGGYSGHGVMLANFVGRLYAESIVGQSKRLDLLRELKVTPFPGGDLLRRPLQWLALSWYSLLDRV